MLLFIETTHSTKQPPLNWRVQSWGIGTLAAGALSLRFLGGSALMLKSSSSAMRWHRSCRWAIRSPWDRTALSTAKRVWSSRGTCLSKQNTKEKRKWEMTIFENEKHEHCSKGENRRRVRTEKYKEVISFFAMLMRKRNTFITIKIWNNNEEKKKKKKRRERKRKKKKEKRKKKRTKEKKKEKKNTSLKWGPSVAISFTTSSIQMMSYSPSTFSTILLSVSPTREPSTLTTERLKMMSRTFCTVGVLWRAWWASGRTRSSTRGSTLWFRLKWRRNKNTDDRVNRQQKRIIKVQRFTMKRECACTKKRVKEWKKEKKRKERRKEKKWNEREELSQMIPPADEGLDELEHREDGRRCLQEDTVVLLRQTEKAQDFCRFRRRRFRSSDTNDEKQLVLCRGCLGLCLVESVGDSLQALRIATECPDERDFWLESRGEWEQRNQ